MSANMRPKNIFTALGIAIYVSGVGYCTIHAVNNNMFLLSWMLIVVVFPLSLEVRFGKSLRKDLKRITTMKHKPAKKPNSIKPPWMES